MGWDKWKRIFLVGATFWLFGSIAVQVARSNRRSHSDIILIDNIGTVFALLSIAVFGLALVLLCRWIWFKFSEVRATRTSPPSSQKPRPIVETPTAGTAPQATKSVRWGALIKYDDEIRAAAEKLVPYGPEWVQQLGDAFFALDENRSYLANIVERLVNEAKAKQANEWKTLFTRTANGEATSKESLAVLLDAQERGYKLGTQSGAFTVSTGSSTTMLYSNDDIRRFGQILAGRPRFG
jgi:hypothetical protein